MPQSPSDDRILSAQARAEAAERAVELVLAELRDREQETRQSSGE